MTTSRDPDRLINAFVREGAEQLDDQIYDAVRADIERKRQRVVIGPWRVPSVSKLVTIGLGAAAVIAVLFLGSRFVGSPSSNVGGPAVEPTPTAEPSPSSTPEGELSTFVLSHPNGGSTITVTIPASGWNGTPGMGVLEKGDAGMIGPFFGELYVYGDPCHWSTTVPETPATTVEEVVAALTGQASRDASAPVDITVDGHAGKSISLHVPDDAVFEGENFTECDEGKFASWAGGGDPPNAGPSRYSQGPGQIDEVWILDVNGELNVIDAFYFEETPPENVDELHAILESMTFGE